MNKSNIIKIKNEVNLFTKELLRNFKFILLFSLILSLIPFSLYLYFFIRFHVIDYHHVLFFYCFSTVLSTLFVISFEDEFERQLRHGELGFRLLMFLSLIFAFSVFIIYSALVFFIKSQLFSSLFSVFIILLFILLNIFILIFIISFSSDRLHKFLYNKFEYSYIFFN